MSSARDELAEAHIVPNQVSYEPASSTLAGSTNGAFVDTEAVSAELLSLRAELEDAIRENLEKRQAIQALDREVMQLRSMLAEAERQILRVPAPKIGGVAPIGSVEVFKTPGQKCAR